MTKYMICSALAALSLAALAQPVSARRGSHAGMTSSCWVEPVTALRAGGERDQIARVDVGAVCSVRFGAIRGIKILDAPADIKADVIGHALVFKVLGPGSHTLRYAVRVGRVVNIVNLRITA